MKLTRLSYLILLILPTVAFSQVYEQTLHSDWQFRKKGDTEWMHAEVPGTVHTDLLNNRIIPDPFYGDNEKSVQWIENENWEYQTIFTCSEEVLSNNHIEIKFDGLDTYANVYLNDTLILQADNMFRSWNIDVKKYVKAGENRLTVLFESAVKKGKETAGKLGYTLPGDERVFTRKAQFQYGWDFGPRLVTSGIWKNIHLIEWNNARIKNCRFIQKSLNGSVAELEFICNIHSDVDTTYFLNLIQQQNTKLKNLSHHKIHLLKGENTVSINNKINHVKYWWSNGLGEPYLYHFSIELLNGQTKLDEKKMDIGLRTLQFIHEKDRDGSSFYFKLNGVPVFMKGANLIPDNIFLTRITQNDEKRILRSAADANMNMLRVWGGGVYASDEFYHQCDEKGILVWQDLMFAGAMYPADQHFIDNVKEEIKEQAIRLQNHPCMALWCGNNEIDEAWHNWGWQKEYHISNGDSDMIWNNYLRLFQSTIPSIMDTFFSTAEEIKSGGNRYWPSSPAIGWGQKESLQYGDSHYWGVWWGNEPIETYKRKVGRFMSEYGIQGMPSVNTIKKFIDSIDVSISSELLKNHQKYPAGFSTMLSYLVGRFKPSVDLENFVYLSQLVQAEGMKTAIEAHRKAMPYCMGSLYWQLNDCWPAISWSSIDYEGTWKASYYQARRSFQNVLISVDEIDTAYSVHIISDLMNDMKGNLELTISDFKGKILWHETLRGIKVLANSSSICCKLGKPGLEKFNKNEIVLSCAFHGHGEKENANTLYYFVKNAHLALKKTSIKIKQKSEHSFILKTDVLAKNIYIHLDDSEIRLSDNYFDLLPGKEKLIIILSAKEFSEIEKKIKIKTLFDTY